MPTLILTTPTTPGQAAWTDSTLVPGGSPSGAAGGDLSGNFPNPTVEGIQGSPISGVAVAGAALVYDGTDWIPTPFGYVGQNIYVDLNAPSGGDGGVIAPFQTIAAAITYVEAQPLTGPGYNILIAPGTYNESVTVTRARTRLVGSQTNRAMSMFVIVRNVTFNCLTSDSPFNAQYGISGIFVSPSVGDCLVVSGTAGCRVFIDNCFFYATPSRCIYVTNTGAGSALRIWDSTLNAEASTGVCIEYDAASTVGTEIRNSSFFGSTAGAVLDSSVASTSFIADSVDISTSGILCVTLTSSVARITNCLISASGVDATGILLASASQMSLVQTGFNVAAGTGYCVQGAAGNVNAYAQVSFAPATNVRFQNTVTNVALTTTPTLAP